MNRLQRSSCHTLLTTLIVLCCGGHTVSAQSTEDQNALIRTLLERIQQLENRVSELERDRTAAVSTRPSTPAVSGGGALVTQAPPAEVRVVPTPDPALVEQESFPKFRLAGFSDVNFSASTQPGSTSGFSEGQFVLHINSQLSPKISYFAELSLTARPPTDMDMGHMHFNAEVERTIIKYDYNDYWKMSFGRYHTPINYWNTQFHHGTWLQTTVSKPLLVSTFIPIHFVGALSEGTVPVRGLNLTYNAGLGNGRGSTLDRAGDAGDLNNNKAWLLNVFARPDRLYALQVGASVYSDKIPVPGRPVREWIQAAHVVWHKENPEIIAEFANASHRQAGASAAANSQSWYVQTAYRIAESHWKPYYRFEYQHVPKSDVVFQVVPNASGSVAGLRWDISNFSAFKFEYRNFRTPELGRVQYGFVQTSFTF